MKNKTYRRKLVILKCGCCREFLLHTSHGIGRRYVTKQAMFEPAKPGRISSLPIYTMLGNAPI